MGNKGSNFYEAIRDITGTLSAVKMERDSRHAVLKVIARALGGDAGMIMILDGKNLVRVAAYGLTEWYLRKGMVSAENACLSEVLSGNTVAILEATEDPQVKHPEVAKHARIVSILSAPLVYQGEVLGVIRVYTRQRREFNKNDKIFLKTSANICAVALANAGLRDVVQKELGKDGAIAFDFKREATGLTSEMRGIGQFAHPSEDEFARLLDFYRIKWIYEPRSFALERDGGRVVEMFTPDFYLPELDLYIEVTTMKQSLATEKNRKIRRLKEMHPDINIKLLNRRDYGRLLAKYGYGPLSEAKVKGIGPAVYSATQIQTRVKELAWEVSIDYADKKPVLIGVLKGVVCFLSDLMQHISIPVTVDFMAISYYSNDKSTPIHITKDLDRSITGRDVIIVEDIVDTGMTLHYVWNHLLARNPASLNVCTLLDKKVRRLVSVPVRYVGFEIPDDFLVGYGLDFRGQYRNLPFIAKLESEITEKLASPPPIQDASPTAATDKKSPK